MWAARCRMMHPNGTHGVSSRQRASDEYAQTLIRTKRRTMPVTRRFYMGLPPTKRNPLLAQWEIAFPTRGTGPLDKWVTRKEGPLPQTKRERSSIRRAAEANRQRTNPDETGRTPNSLTVSKRNGKRRRTTGADTPGRAGVTRRPTPPVGQVQDKRKAQDRGRVSPGGEVRPQGARRAPRQPPPRPEGEDRSGLVLVTDTHSPPGGQRAREGQASAAAKRPREDEETAHQRRSAAGRQTAGEPRPRKGADGRRAPARRRQADEAR